MSEFNRILEQRLAQRNVEQAQRNLYEAQAYYNGLLRGQDVRNMMASYGIGEAPSYSDVQNYQMRCGGKPKAAWGDIFRKRKAEQVPPQTEQVPPQTEQVPPPAEQVPPAAEQVPPAVKSPTFNTEAPFYFTPTPYNVRRWQGRDMAATKDAYTQVYGYHPEDEAWAKGLAMSQAGIRDPEVDALLPRRVRNRSVGYMMMNSNPNYFNKPADITDAAEVTDTAEGNDATQEQAAAEKTEQTPIDTNPIKTEGAPATGTATSSGNGRGTVTSGKGNGTVNQENRNGTRNQGNGNSTSNHLMFTSPAQVKKEAQEKIYNNITSPQPGDMLTKPFFNTSGKSPKMPSNPSQFFGWTGDKPNDLEFGLNTPKNEDTVYTPGQNSQYTEQKVAGSIDDIASEYFKNNPGATKFYTQDDKGKPITIYNEKNLGSYRKNPTRGLYNVNGKYLEALSETDGARKYFKNNPSATEINVNGRTYYNFGNGDVRTYPRKYANGGPTDYVDEYLIQEEPYYDSEEPWVSYYGYGGDPYQGLPYNPNDTTRFRTKRLPLKKGQNIKDYNNPFQPL